MSEICARCGNRLPEGEAVCAQCGTEPPDIWGEHAKPTPQPRPHEEDANDARRRAARRRSAVIYSGFVLVIVALVAAIIGPNFLRARARGADTSCKSNLINIGTACEMYSTDNGGNYPLQLDAVRPNYLKTIPTCPSTGDVTYRRGYASVSNPDAFTVVCSGLNHSGVSDNENYPQYTSTQGLLEK